MFPLVVPGGRFPQRAEDPGMLCQKITDRRVIVLFNKEKPHGRSFMRRIGASILTIALMGSAFVGLPAMQTEASAAVTTTLVKDYGLAKTSQEGATLHCWNWSYNNIKKYMKDIAAAGYTSIQTSPVQQPKDYYWEGVAYGNVGIPDGTGGVDSNWWKAYQPVTFSICNNGYTWYGTKAEFKAMCDEAEKYGVRVIVDIVANHMGNIQGYKIASTGMTQSEKEKAVMSDISRQVGEFWKKDMLTDSSYWHLSTSWTHSSDGRFDVTQGNMGMPDLNTGDKKVQQMVLGLLKECIDCGADGFRFDAAKHIETPADNKAFASDFWDVVLDGARAYYKQVNGYDGIYFYGEVLNRLDDVNAENYYLSKMSITDNSTSDNMRNSVMNGQTGALADGSFNSYIHGKGNRAVIWPESHDTYMGGGSSYDANDRVIKQTWAIMASRKDPMPLFFARPYYSKDILAGDVSKARQSPSAILEKIDEQTQLGDVGTLTWADPAVVAANRFRNFFIGQSERLGSSGSTAYNVRGKTGIVIVRGQGPGSVSLSVGMQDGTYYDQITGEKFTVTGGTIKGTIKNADGIAVIYNPKVDYGKVTPEAPTVIRISAESSTGSAVFNTDSTTVNIKVTGAETVSYSTSEGKSGSFTGTSKSITIGTYTATGEDVTLTVTGKAKDGTKKSKSYVFTKKVVSSEYPTLKKGGVAFDNSGYNWPKVYCYAYNDSGSTTVKNGEWPGALMNDEGTGYWTYEFPTNLSGTVKVIFSNGAGVQIPGSGQPGLPMSSTDKKLFRNDKLNVLPASVKTLSVSLAASSKSVKANQAVTLTATAKNAKGTVNYTFLLNDGTTLKASSTSNTCKWTPKKAGTYIVAVNAKDSSYSITSTVKIVVSSDGTLASGAHLSATKVTLGGSVTLYGSASSGMTPYQYSYFYKKAGDTSYTMFKNYTTATSAVFKPTAAGDYVLLVKVKDKAGRVSRSTVKLTVVKPVALSNTSALSYSQIYKNSSVTITMSGKGGAGGYTYAAWYRKKGATSWTLLRAYATGTSVSYKPLAAGDYEILTKVKDKSGTTARKQFSLKVIDNTLKNTSKISAVSIKLGSKVTVTASATGGKTPYQYAIYYKRASVSTWTPVSSYSTKNVVTITPKSSTNYEILVKIKDASGKVVRKTFTIKVVR